MASRLRINKIKSSWLGLSDLRLDASFHLSDGPSTKLKLKKSPYQCTTLMGESERIFSGNIFKRVFVTSAKKGWLYLTGSDMIKSDINNAKYISKKYTTQAEKLRIKKDWILISCSGTLGNCVYTNDDFNGRIGTHDLIRIIPKKNNVKSGYLYAYLASKYGHGLLIQSSYGGVVQHIEPHHIKDLPIPILPEDKQQEIHMLITETSRLRVDAYQLLRNAIDYFENKIGISNVHMGYQYASIKSNSLNEFHKRLDGQYQLLWKELKQEVRIELPYSKIGNYAKSIFVGGRSKRNYIKNGIPFLSSSDMILFNPKRGCKQVSKNNKGLDSMIVSKNDILISRSGSVGNTIIVGDDLSGTAISEHALRLVIDQELISPNYVFCFLKTKYGIRSMEASSFGSVIVTLNEDLIGNINMPLLDEDSQRRIIELVNSYLTKIDKATSYENAAIDLVEKEIESWQEY